MHLFANHINSVVFSITYKDSFGSLHFMIHEISGLQAGHLSSQSYYSTVLLQYVQNVNGITVLE